MAGGALQGEGVLGDGWGGEGLGFAEALGKEGDLGVWRHCCLLLVLLLLVLSLMSMFVVVDVDVGVVVFAQLLSVILRDQVEV